jgi:hypothetical protein
MEQRYVYREQDVWGGFSGGGGLLTLLHEDRSLKIDLLKLKGVKNISLQTITGDITNFLQAGSRTGPS